MTDSDRNCPSSCDKNATEIRTRLFSLKADGRVRLDHEEIAALVYALQKVEAESISLFGSRVEPNRRGGDIDILLFTGAQPFETAQDVAVRFFSRCEEKIDVVVMNPNELTPEQSDFLSRITCIGIRP